MGISRVLVFCFIMITFIACCLAAIESCGNNEGSNAKGICQRTCNACRDCSPCLCKPGYIRKSLGEECITEAECHTLHLEWLRDAKHKDKKDKFFHCPK